MPNFLPEGNTVLASDNELRTLWKIASLLGGGGGGGVFGSTILRGAGDPNGVVTGSATSPIYIDTNTYQQWVWTSGTSWI